MKNCSGITALALIVIQLAVSIFSAGCSCLRQACQPYGPRVTGDGSGGVVIAWGSGKTLFNSEKSYVQRVDSNGNLLWGNDGIRLNP